MKDNPFMQYYASIYALSMAVMLILKAIRGVVFVKVSQWVDCGATPSLGHARSLVVVDVVQLGGPTEVMWTLLVTRDFRLLVLSQHWGWMSCTVVTYRSRK